jgi:hypothetical protein
MPELWGIPLNVATPFGLLLSIVALNITAYTRGWIHPNKVVQTMLGMEKERSDLIWKLYETEKSRGDVLEGMVEQLKVVGETQIKILNALPVMNKNLDGSVT